MNAPDVTEVVNACDAGREGELIFPHAHEPGRPPEVHAAWISSMEDSAIREGFCHLRPRRDYDGLHQAPLCRAKADRLVGINTTRLCFSVLYHRTLNIGRAHVPDAGSHRPAEAEIDAFKPVPFYTVALDLPGFTAASARMDKKADAEQLKNACQGGTVTVKQIERRDKSEKPPALYDLTTLQRDANRLLGFTAQQTLDYLQNLYEKSSAPSSPDGQPLPDLRHGRGLPVLVNLVANAMPFRKGYRHLPCDAPAVINDKKVTDHHAVIPTRNNIREADLSALPVGERQSWSWWPCGCVRWPSLYLRKPPFTVECAGAEFTAKGRTVKNFGWRALDAAYRASMKNAAGAGRQFEDKGPARASREGQALPVTGAAVKEGQDQPAQSTSPRTLLSAMETAGKDDMPEDAERKGLGTPATRAGILENWSPRAF